MIRLEPIGSIVSDNRNSDEAHPVCKVGTKYQGVSRIFLKEHFKPGMEGLSHFSHIWVIYFLERVNKMDVKAYPGPSSVKGLPEVGVFASRSQYRPNHIALRLVKLLDINDNIIEVEGLDAVDGSPVLDIKPFISGFDTPENPKIAEWYRWLDD
jgi:tRNA-Thr(GGU) m(6)t(6)A37 methyltransferase TsaA